MAWIIVLLFLAKQAGCIMNPGFKASPPDIYASSLSSNQFSSLHGDQIPESESNAHLENHNHGAPKLIPNTNTNPNSSLENSWSPIKIEMTPSSSYFNGSGMEKMVHFLVKNDGKDDEYVHVSVSDEKGYTKGNSASEFALPSQSSKEVSVRMDYPLNYTPNTFDLLTIQATGKRNTVKRSIPLPPIGNELEYGRFCYDRYVNGNCRYRTDPEYCFLYEWTANAIVESIGGVVRSIQSEPEGLLVEGGQGRVRVWVKTSCCVPYVRILSIDHSSRVISTCTVDVRELQGLHPGEIAGIVLGILLILFVIIGVVIAVIVRRRKARSISVGHITHIQSRSRECVSREINPSSLRAATK